MPIAEPKLRICEKCVLPETFPGVTLDENGVCNHCLKTESAVVQVHDKKILYRQRLDQLVDNIKERMLSYDVIMAYSGGKDSSYTLKLLKERYDLRIIALTFDNHFVSKAAWENIEKVTGLLKIDLIKFRPPWSTIKKLFCLTAKEDIFSPITLVRASSICTVCIGLVKSLVLKTGLEMSIPLSAFGWSPGQAPIQAAIMKTNPGLIRQNQRTLKKAFTPEISNELSQYFIPDTYYEEYKDRFPHNIHPLAFFEYNEKKIVDQLREIGWKTPLDTDSNSTNCRLNAFANQCHLQRHGFHPYVMEIANMVRQGVMTRDEGVQKIYTEQNQEEVEYARERLGL